MIARIGRKMPVVVAHSAKRITPTQTARIATVTNAYFME